MNYNCGAPIDKSIICGTHIANNDVTEGREFTHSDLRATFSFLKRKKVCFYNGVKSQVGQVEYRLLFAHAESALIVVVSFFFFIP